MSGLNQRFTKPSYLNRYREFESHRLRRKNKVSVDSWAYIYNVGLLSFNLTENHLEKLIFPLNICTTTLAKSIFLID